ncbi:MAG: NUDIX hydrolase, partial [Terriglobales bacterium]
RVLRSRIVFRGPVFRVTSETVVEPGGVVARRDVVRHPGSVVVLAMDGGARDAHVLLERQYRHAAGGFLWELPAGRIDHGETALAAARRELLEETGYTSRRWKRALVFYSSPGFLDETMTVYLARGLQAGRAQPEADELITIRFFPLATALRMATGGAIRDGKTLAALFWFACVKVGRRR